MEENNPEIDLGKYRQLIFGQGTRGINGKKDTFFQQTVLEPVDILMQKIIIVTVI